MYEWSFLNGLPLKCSEHQMQDKHVDCSGMYTKCNWYLIKII